MKELELKKLLNQCLTKEECIELIMNKLEKEQEIKNNKFAVGYELNDLLYDYLDKKLLILLDENKNIIVSLNVEDDDLMKIEKMRKEINKINKKIKDIDECTKELLERFL